MSEFANRTGTLNKRTGTGLLAMDLALLLLGMAVLLLVLRLLKFDDPNPLYNAWVYLLGIPTSLIAISMLTRVLASDTVEKSIQLGFLISVTVHLLLIFFAASLVLFKSSLMADAQQVVREMVSNKTSAPQYFQPSSSKAETRPDYLKPVPTTQNDAQPTLDPQQRADESAKLSLEVAQDQFEPQLNEQPFNKPRREAAASQPTITSAAKPLERPETNKNFDASETEIAVPTLRTSPSNPTQSLQASETKLRVKSSLAQKQNSLAEMLDAKVDTKSPTRLGPTQEKMSAKLSSDPTRTDRELEIAMNRSIRESSNRARPVRSEGEIGSTPSASQPISPSMGANAGQTGSGDTSSELPSMDILVKPDLGSRRSDTKSLANQGKQSMSLSSSLGQPELDLGKTALTGPLLNSLINGSASTRREIDLPEINDADAATGPLKRPETGGLRLGRSAVPIPAPAFSQRLRRNLDSEENAEADLGALGPKTEAAIERGLQFLAKYQRKDGSWHLEDFGERVDIRSETAATALSLLSFQGAGYTHRQFKYEKVCAGALQWMTQNQRPNGDLYVRTDAKSDGNAWLYSHSIATLALCEAYGMTQDETIRDNAQRAIDFLVQSQDPQGGGWRYQPRIGSDTSVTGWCMMALKSAELSGLKVPQESYQGIEKWLQGSQASDQQKYLYRYNWLAADSPATRHGRVPTPVMTSVGLLMRLYLGWKRDNLDMARGADWLKDRLPAEGTPQNPQRDTYYWYYATQVMFHMGGERWKAWYGKLYPMLITTQQSDGEYMGSWEPNGRIPDAWGRFGGRLYVTTLNLLSLEVYYRHLPIYEAAAD